MSGERLPAELIVIGVGIIPNVELAAEAGLDVENGVKTDEALLTSDPVVSASATARASPIRRRVFPRAWSPFRTRRITRAPWRRR
jgi:NADPH-dependent 2,4-dienoyl-CoA reductase/sulfur reductase-like enzyme